METGKMLEGLLTLNRREKQERMVAAAEAKVCDLESSDLQQHSTRFIRDIEKILKKGIKRVDRPYISLYPVQHAPWSGDVTLIVKNQPDAIPGGKPDEKQLERDIPNDQIVGIGLFYKDWFGEQKYAEILRRVIKVWRSNPENAVPIYDLGDKSLLWPKQMTQEEIVQMMSENPKK